MNPTIKEGTHNDAHAIASVHVKSWQTTYRGIISDDYLDSLDVSERTKRWEKNLSDPDQKVFVALEGENIIGFATCGKSEEQEGYDSTLSSIYILEKYQGNGLGRKLIHACTSYLQSLGCRSMYIWVLAHNPAKSFYERMGGEYRTEKEVLIGDGNYKEYMYSFIIEAITRLSSGSIKEINIDKLSYCSIPLTLYFGEKVISNGSGFFYNFNNNTYLITNWHVITGINSITGEFLSKYGAQPNFLEFPILKQRKPFIKWDRKKIELYQDAEMLNPKWIIHPIKGKCIDVVALELGNKGEYMVPYINEQDFSDIKLLVSDDVFILGFPYNLKGGGNFPIWKKGSVATEPGVDIDLLPKILIDTASKEGMSGAPVIYRRTGIHNLGKGGIMNNDSIIGEIQGFVGVYSGRIVGKSDLDAQLGTVWKKEVIEEILKGNKKDSRKTFFDLKISN